MTVVTSTPTISVLSDSDAPSEDGPLEASAVDQSRGTESFYGDEITIGYFDPLPTSAVANLLDSLNTRFHKVRAERRPSPPWASPILEWAAITVTISAGMVMKGFLEELGKDIWRGIRIGLYGLNKTAKSGARYPSFHAFSLETTVDGTPVTFGSLFRSNAAAAVGL